MRSDRLIRAVNPVSPDPALMSMAAGIIREGGVIVVPTTGLYGLAADALNPDAVDRVFGLKQRPASNPLLVLVSERIAISRLATTVPERAVRLMERFWPGKVTLVFEAAYGLSSRLTAGTGKLGIRMPGHPVARALADLLDAPITGTSANLSGRPGCSRIQDLDPELLNAVDLVLDAGELEGGKGSTVVDVTANPAHILREGSVPVREILACLDNFVDKSPGVD